jgi:hypothetical protein
MDGCGVDVKAVGEFSDGFFLVDEPLCQLCLLVVELSQAPEVNSPPPGRLAAAAGDLLAEDLLAARLSEDLQLQVQGQHRPEGPPLIGRRQPELIGRCPIRPRARLLPGF